MSFIYKHIHYLYKIKYHPIYTGGQNLCWNIFCIHLKFVFFGLFVYINFLRLKNKSTLPHKYIEVFGLVSPIQ